MGQLSRISIERLAKLAEDADEIEELCGDIARTFCLLAEGGLAGEVSGRAAAMRWLRSVAYVLLARASDDETLMGVLEDRIAAHKRRDRGVLGQPNTFQTGLLAIFAQSTEGPSSAERLRVGRQLAYAYRHMIPLTFLEGFLRDVGLASALANANSGHFEPNYRDWVIARLADPAIFEDKAAEYPTLVAEVGQLLSWGEVRADHQERLVNEQDGDDGYDEWDDVRPTCSVTHLILFGLGESNNSEF